MSDWLRKCWPLFFISAFLFFPKTTLAADWTNIGFADKNIQTVYVDSKDNQHIIVSLVVYVNNNYNYYTDNGGRTWQPVNMGGSMTPCNEYTEIPSSSNELWAACSGGLFHSTDKGRSFAKIANPIIGSHLNQVKILDNGNMVVTIAGGSIAISDKGLIWKYVTVPGGSSNSILYKSPFEPNSLYLYANSFGAVNLTKTNDGGNTWTQLSTKQALNYVNKLYFLSDKKICATSNSQIGCSLDGGITWGSFSYIEDSQNYDVIYGIQNLDEPKNIILSFLRYRDGSSAIYTTEDGAMSWKPNVSLTKTTGLYISQGVVFSWASSTGWIKGLWRNDGIAVIPEYLKKHPVIIVPGMLGSWPKYGSWQLDPFLHTYTDLVDTFKNNGYELGTNLFVFPYDWHLDNNHSAELLKQKIDEAKRICDANKVDIVAHSMGGLVTRVYAESSAYQNDIDQIVFLGTPHLGSPESYPVWESGDVSFNKNKIQGAIFRYLFAEEAKHSNYTGPNAIHDYIRNKVPSINQLLPISDYLRWFGNDSPFTYPMFYPRNPFLEQLEANMALIKQRGIGVTNIVTDDISGPTGFRVSNYNGLDGIWEDGMPHNYDIDESGILFGSGDGTVPISSAVGLEGDNVIIKGIRHIDIPKLSISTIFDKLHIPLQNKPSISDSIKKYLFISAYSPVDFYVLSPDGKRIGFNKDGVAFNEISGAFYTGNDTTTEFLTIPNPLPGEYKVVTMGTGTGNYKIEATYADDTINKSVSSSYNGQASPGKEDDLLVELAPDASTIETKIDDKAAPITTSSLEGNKVGEYYNTDVKVTLTAVDIESGVKKTEYSLDGIVWQDYNGPILLNHDGETSIDYRSVDNAGNIEVLQNLNIKLDKTVPTVTIDLNMTTLTHWDTLKLSCKGSDNYSGISTFTVKLDGVVIDCQKEVNLFDQTLGTHKIEYTVVDNAGNVITGERIYQVTASFNSTLRDISWLYNQNHFKNRGDAVSVAVHIEIAWLFDAFGLKKRTVDSLNQATSLLNKQIAKNKVTSYGYDMITMDIKYILEGK